MRSSQFSNTKLDTDAMSDNKLESLHQGKHVNAKKSRLNWYRFGKFVFIALFLAVSFMCYKFYKELNILQSPQLQAAQVKEEIDQLTAKIGKLMVLPAGEAPVVATVNDAKTLASQQAFYKDAVNGDKLLIYTVAQKAILYSPSRNLIVNVGPFISSNVGDVNAANGAGTQQTKQEDNKARAKAADEVDTNSTKSDSTEAKKN